LLIGPEKEEGKSQKRTAHWKKERTKLKTREKKENLRRRRKRNCGSLAERLEEGKRVIRQTYEGREKKRERTRRRLSDRREEGSAFHRPLRERGKKALQRGREIKFSSIISEERKERKVVILYINPEEGGERDNATAT